MKKSSLVKVRVNVNRPSSWEGRCDRKAAAGAATTEPGHRGRERESLPCSKSNKSQ